LLQAIPTLFGLSILIFTITRIIPGDPVTFALQGLEGGASEEAVRRLREDMFLERPIHEQYIHWVVNFLQGDWGFSLRTRQNTIHDIIETLPATLEVSLISLFVAIIIGLPLGIIAGTNKDRLPDHLSRLYALIGMSIPRWWIAIVFQVIFVAILGIFPLTGRLTRGIDPPPEITGFYLVDSAFAGQWNVFVDAGMHIVLPAVALSVTTLAQIMRLIRSDMIDQESKNYIIAARANGVPDSLITYKYKLKNSFSSSLTIIGLAIGGLLGAAFLVELVFAWRGFARYGVQALIFQDVNAIVAVTMVIGIAYMFINLIVDILYGYLDPRIRLEGGE